METPRLATMLRTLSSHLRPDVAKIIAACADTISSSSDYAAATETLLESFRTKKQRAVLQQMVELLRSLAALSDTRRQLTEFADAVSMQIAEPSFNKGPPSRPIKRKPEKAHRTNNTNAIAPGVAEQFAADLVEAQQDRDRFPKLLQQLKDSKRINTATLHRIAHVFLGKKEPYSGRKQALEDIIQRHHDALRIAEQDRMLDRLN
jgi:hypothetical protein